MDEFKDAKPVTGHPILYNTSRLTTIAQAYLGSDADTQDSVWTFNERYDGVEDLWFQAVVVNPDAAGLLKYVFVDTVVLSAEVSIVTMAKPGPTGEVVGEYKNVDGAVGAMLGQIFDSSARFLTLSVAPGEDPLAATKGIQQYYISTCNLPVQTVLDRLQEIVDGKYQINGKPVNLVRLDTTINFTGAVIPMPLTGKDNELIPPLTGKYGWDYKDNRHMVGDTCHTYVLRKFPGTDKPELEGKGYDKFRYMLECDRVGNVLGDLYKYILVSPERNIANAFKDPCIQSRGFSRAELRWYGKVPDLDVLASTTYGFAQIFQQNHCCITSLQESYDSIFPENYCQYAFLVNNLDTNRSVGAYIRHWNSLTGKINGRAFSKKNKDADNERDLYNALLHTTYGHAPIRFLKFNVQGGNSQLVASDYYDADPSHKGNLFYVNTATGYSKIAALAPGMSWKNSGLDIPLRLDNRLGKPRNLQCYKQPAVKVPTKLAEKEAIKEERAKQKAAAAARAKKKREKRRQDKINQLMAKVQRDSNATASSWSSVKHISELIAVKKPICTTYYYDEDTKFPAFYFKVGAKWYRANMALSNIFSRKKPKPPFWVHVSDSGARTVKGYKIYDVWVEDINPDTF